jgi:hypothetical protein
MKLYNDVDFLFEINFDNEKFLSYIRELTDFDWDRESLDRIDFLPQIGKSKVIFYDHFEAVSKYESFSDMYSKNIGEDAILLRDHSKFLLDEITKLMPDHVFVKGEISCCFPHSIQRYHIDPKVFHMHCRRIHLPLITNEKSFLDVRGKWYHLNVGKLYEFNNMVRHRSLNIGKTSRIHIIVDIIKQSQLDKCLEKYGESFYQNVTKQ